MIINQTNIINTASKLPQVIERTVTEITAEDLAGATKIVNYAFYTCRSLTSVTIPNSVTDIGYEAFGYCDSLTSVTIPNSVITMGYEAFGSCKNLMSVTIPNSVTSVGDRVFAGCTNLKSITIGSGVTSIGHGALNIATSFIKATITFLGTTPPSIQTDTFVSSKLEKIIVPAGCGEAYKSATNWANFADYIEEATE